MKKNKLNYDAAIKQMDMLLPDDMLDDNKNAITICKEAGMYYSPDERISILNSI